MPKPWRVLDSRINFRDRFLSHRMDRCETPHGVIVEPYHVIELPNWVNMVPVTGDGQVLMIREYRHGIGEVVLGLPSGTVDPGETDPLGTAKRELAEETGAEAPYWVQTGQMFPNAATMNNTCFSFLAVGAEVTGETSFDEAEDIETVPVPLVELYERLLKRDLRMTAMHLVGLHEAGLYILTSGDPKVAGLKDILAPLYSPT
ncbi:NUDIX hydrolase [Nisaea acidiphila]|uniref:NUDIX hydrolase n=1 Tax=Nisaea acidiphila TaxID=1862145 RepID=A0A9J7B338_9PROT|nr:NUDIX hydrolase [Nisaea acidiphila]UUX52061.1 NUDIX hydrolase [Nisaea acidiphila]